MKTQPFQNRTELLAIEFVLRELKKLMKLRDKAGFDAKAEQGTYDDGYYEALHGITNKIINKYNLK